MAIEARAHTISIFLSICLVSAITVGCDGTREPQKLFDELQSLDSFGQAKEARITLIGDIDEPSVTELELAIDERVSPSRRITRFHRDANGIVGLLEHDGDPWLLAAHLRALQRFSSEHPDVEVALQEMPDGRTVRIEAGRIVETRADTRRFLELMDRNRWDYRGAFDSVTLCGNFSSEAGGAFQSFVRDELSRRFEPSDVSTTNNAKDTCFTVQTDGRVRAASSAIRGFSMAWMRTRIEHNTTPLSGKGRVLLSGEEEIKQTIRNEDDLMRLEWELTVSKRQPLDARSPD